MIKLRKGTSRIVFIISDFLVIKFPNPRFGLLKHKFRQRKSFGGFLKTAIHSTYMNIMYGMAANISEGLIFAVVGSKAPHLTPIYTLGIMNISKYEGSKRPTREEIETFYDSLSDISKKMLNKCDSHSKAPGNWRKTKRGLKLIDYGADPLTTPWALFIFYHNQELNEATGRTGKLDIPEITRI